MIKFTTLSVSAIAAVVTLSMAPLPMVVEQVGAEPFQPKVEGAPSRRVGGWNSWNDGRNSFIGRTIN